MGFASGQIKIHSSSKKLLNSHFLSKLDLKENLQHMSQATQLPFPSFSEEEKIELPNEPRLLFIRVSLDIAMHQDNELRRLVNSNDPADARQALAILQAEANGVPEKELISLCWGHQNASYQLLHTEADSDAFSYSDEDLFFAQRSSKSRAKLKCTSWSYIFLI